MHYIRFLKVPRINTTASPPTLTALLTIDTDLSDALFAPTAELTAHILAAPSAPAATKETLAKQALTWPAGARTLALTVPLRPALLKQKFVVHVSSSTDSELVNVGPQREPISAVDDASLIRMPVLVAVTSSPIHHAAGVFASSHRVARTIELRAGDIRIWEDTGESMARHVWDGGVAAAALLSRIAEGHQVRLPSLCGLLGPAARRGNVRVLELGAGCGIAGVTLAAAVKRASVTLTDLEDAREVVVVTLQGLQEKVKRRLVFEVCDWESEHTPAGKWDLVMAVECVYNEASIPLLVDTIVRVVTRSPGALVFVVSKRRHESEALFWRLMGEKGFGVVDRTTVVAPKGWATEDLEEGEEDKEIVEAVMLRLAGTRV